MAIPVMIIGKSGSGKSASMRNFSKDEIDIINVESKPLPFRNDFKTIDTDIYKEVCKALLDSKKNTLVIDDAGYLITNSFMRGHSNAGKGNGVFSLYNQLADDFWKLITFIKSKIPADKVVYLMMHEDKNDFGDVKPKTIGKLLDEKVCLEGMVTIVLRAVYSNEQYIFKTKTDGMDVTKTPIGLFELSEIENDLKVVNSTIREYYNMDSKKGNKE